MFFYSFHYFRVFSFYFIIYTTFSDLSFNNVFDSCQKELGFDINKANVNGGALALGHPLGASGARILTHLTHELVRTGKKYAIGAACIGGGQGIAVLLQSV